MKGSQSKYGDRNRIYKFNWTTLEFCQPDHDERVLKKVQTAMAKTNYPGGDRSDSHNFSVLDTRATVFECAIPNEEDFILGIRLDHIRAKKRT